MNHLHFATIFDINYLSRGLALYNSILVYHLRFTLYVIALDEDTVDYFNRNTYDNIKIIRLADIESYFSELSELKKVRSKVSYTFTLSPYYPLYILNKFSEIPHICTLDADQYFFNSSEIIFKDLDSASVLITPHRFTTELLKKNVEKYGKFNVSFQVFKNDKLGLECLDYWRSQCKDWCSDELVGDKFADQKYLESWTHVFGDGVKEIDHIGLGLAPWNINNWRITISKGSIHVADQPLILFHYQGLRILDHQFVYIAFDRYMAKTSSVIRNSLIKPIVTQLIKFQSATSDKIGRQSVERFNVDSISEESKSSYLRLIGRRLITFNTYMRIRNFRKRLS